LITAALSAQKPRWFSAWAAAHNVGLVVDGLNGASVRLIVRPTLSGQSLRVKFSNIRGNTPAVFSAAFIGVAGSGAAVVPGTSRRLTFRGAQSLTLAPDEMTWSDPVSFDVQAFQRLAVSLDIISASDVSMDTLALVTTYRAAGHHAADAAGDGFAAIPSNAPDSKVDEYPMYWLSALDVESSSAASTIVAVGDSWIDGRCSTTEGGRVLPDLYQRWIDVLATRLAKERRRNRAPSSMQGSRQPHHPRRRQWPATVAASRSRRPGASRRDARHLPAGHERPRRRRHGGAGHHCDAASDRSRSRAWFAHYRRHAVSAGTAGHRQMDCAV
jgi:hypothetical protein